MSYIRLIEFFLKRVEEAKTDIKGFKVPIAVPAFFVLKGPERYIFLPIPFPVGRFETIS